MMFKALFYSLLVAAIGYFVLTTGFFLVPLAVLIGASLSPESIAILVFCLWYVDSYQRAVIATIGGGLVLSVIHLAVAHSLELNQTPTLHRPWHWYVETGFLLSASYCLIKLLILKYRRIRLPHDKQP
ncbi:hypothetical protein HFK74_31670|uniref:hypothetical protein n=1 Tax=Pseudomonas sp. SbOxS1 TaxID=2723884 RepID=UPI0015D13C17|nr:hypothetical protein [Pseudomonas sp. SbOxS1]NYU07271.1 hypothetical protein [Pseudomonas sp. SbOxS1]